MILADKIIYLRRRAGWSQEELAQQLNVSRQSVSKWEGAQSIPDMEKILQLSKIFNVSTDYLLKDEMEDLPKAKNEKISNDQDEKIIQVTIEDANNYMKLKKESASKTALGVFLCIISSIPLILLNKVSDAGLLSISSSQAQSIGIVTLIGFIAAALTLFINCAFNLREYKAYKRKSISTTYGVNGMVQSNKDNYKKQHLNEFTIGIILLILSIVPILVGWQIEDTKEICTSICLLIAAFGAFLISRTFIIWSSFNVILEKGRYIRSKKQLYYVRKAYWLIVLAIYLLMGNITTLRWSKLAIIIWPVAGVISVAAQTLLSRKNK